MISEMTNWPKRLNLHATITTTITTASNDTATTTATTSTTINKTTISIAGTAKAEVLK